MADPWIHGPVNPVAYTHKPAFSGSDVGYVPPGAFFVAHLFETLVCEIDGAHQIGRSGNLHTYALAVVVRFEPRIPSRPFLSNSPTVRE